MSRMYEINHGNAPRCSHVFETNRRCEAPALRNRDFCYWHLQNRKYTATFTVPLLETQHAIQATLSRVLADVYQGKMDTKRANSMFYGLSLAMYNVRNISNSGSSEHIIDLPPAMQDHVGADVPVCPTIDDASVGTGAIARSGSLSGQETTTPPFVILTEAKDPGTADTTTDADTLSNHESNDSLPPKIPPTCVGAESSDHQIPRSPAHQMTLPPEHFAAPHPLDLSGPFLLREQRFTRDEMRAYWTQHLPAEVRDLRSTDGEPFYEAPDWLPLTQEEIAFLRDNKAENRGAGTPEQNFWYERLVKHHSCHNILPPKPKEVLKHYQGPDGDRSLAEILTNALRERAAKVASPS